uniref:hypothetical protein n=1 Tax=Lysobacter firmicutimachus TaxID=1792846 RepID=UPI003F4E0805
MPNCSDSSNRSQSCRPERGLAALAAASARRGRALVAWSPIGSGARPAAAAQAGAASEEGLLWRPSRLLAAGLIALGPAAAWACLGSELAPPLAWPLSAAALAWAAHSARSELRRPPQRLLLRGGRAWLDGRPLSSWSLHWRGWLARLEYRDDEGRRGRLLWWPDTLPPAQRRELRLAAAVSLPTAQPRSVAP